MTQVKAHVIATPYVHAGSGRPIVICWRPSDYGLFWGADVRQQNGWYKHLITPDLPWRGSPSEVLADLEDWKGARLPPDTAVAPTPRVVQEEIEL